MNQWLYESDEQEGLHPDKAWLTNGKERALFKPDTEDKESDVELEVFNIAYALEIPCARIEIIEFEGKRGSISYDVKDRDSKEIVYKYPDDLFYKHCGVTYASRDAHGNQNERVDIISLETVRNCIPHIETNVVDMIFLDCLVRNGDRHGLNWELIVKNDDGGIIGMTPLFDHGKSLWIDFLTMNECRIPYEDDSKELTHYKMFERLSYDYSEQIKNLLEKCAGIELHDFVKPRYCKMCEIFERVQGGGSKS